jgi:aminobenzoyl-glutamate utilization protein B
MEGYTVNELASKIKAYMEKWLENNKQEFYELADFIWAHPELGLEEYLAHKKITDILRKHGFSVESGLGGMPTSFVATYGTEGPVVGVNVEYDALPGLSQQSNVPYPNPVIDGAPGHGCGHNILGSTAVMAGVALRYALEEFKVKAVIKMLGCPYEEASVGKPLLGRAGVFSGIDFILDWHPWNYNRADYDACNSVFVLNFHFKGKTCHGAMPWLGGRSALDAAMLFAHALEMLREHIIPNGPEAAHTINYTFTDTGPEFANVVPDRTTVQLYGRFNDLDVSQDALRRITLCAEGAALATETTVTREFITYTHNKLPNKTLAEVVHKNFRYYGAPEFTEEEQEFVKKMQRQTGLEPTGLDTTLKEFGPSETIICDTSEFSWNAPYATFWLSMGPAGGWHNWMVTACAGNSIGKKTMDKAARIMSASAIDIILSPETIEKAKAELKERLGGKTYQCLLPEGHKPPLGINKEKMDKYFPDRMELLKSLLNER